MKILTTGEILDLSQCYPDREHFGRAIEQAILERIGEPVAWMSSRNGFICKENKNPEYNTPLFAIKGVE